MLVLLLPFTLAANAKEYIKIGLESVYRDVNEVHIDGGEQLSIGHTEEGAFYPSAVLRSSSVKLRPATQNYYRYDHTYPTLGKAIESATQEEVIAYEGPNQFAIYTTYGALGTQSIAKEFLIEVYNTYGEVILLSNTQKGSIAFQGNDKNYAFPVTKVGNDRLYRGSIEMAMNNSKLTPVSVVFMDDYLYGVVPVEMSASWPQEALKAQAIASRSIATVQYNRYVSRGYNVVDTTAVQVYRGVTVEHVNTTAAVNATKGQVAMYGNAVAETVYFSTSGGYTEDSENVWGSFVPYLRAVEDLFETKPSGAPWNVTITLSDLDKALANAGISIGNAQGMSIVSKTQAGRVAELQIIGTRGIHTLTRENIRTFFSGTAVGSLRSRMFKFTPYEDTTSSGSGQVTAPTSNSKQMSIMSANDFVQTSLNGMQIRSAQTMATASEGVFIQSSSGIVYEQIKISTNASNASNRGNSSQNINVVNEVIYGDVTLFGKGYGHGVGMSQSGARGMAEAGYTFEEILTYYFPGIYLSR
jgi:stage II sporulation protein D